MKTTLSVAQIGKLGLLSGAPPASTEFFLAFEGIIDTSIYYTDFDDVCFASDEDTAVSATITCRADSGLHGVIQIPPHGGGAYRIPSRKLRMTTSEIVTNVAIHVISTAPINCYGVHFYAIGADGFTAFPKTSAGYIYRAISYHNPPFTPPYSVPQLYSEFAVCAFEDSTDIEIVPSVRTFQGAAAGITQHYRLDAGQSVQIATNDTLEPGDLTGSTIVSNRPVAVYSGHFDPWDVPSNYNLPSESYASGLYEGMIPVSLWGRTFIARTIAPRDTIIPSLISIDSIVGDVVRILSLHENTTVSINGMAWGASLGANQFRDTLISHSVLIETSGPALCAEYAHAAYISTDTLGNDFLTLVPPIEQSVTNSSFYLTKDSDYLNQYLNIETEISGKGKLLLDGTAVPDTIFHDLPKTRDGKQYSIGALPVSKGYHRLSTTNDAQHGFTAIAYGGPNSFSDSTGGRYPDYSAYGYTVAMALNTLQALLAEQIPSSDGTAPMKVTDIIQENVALDSATITLDSTSKAKGYKVTASKIIGHDLVSILQGTKDTVILKATPKPIDTVSGTLTIFHHTSTWNNLYPAVGVFHIAPSTQAVVKSTMTGRELTFHQNYPNPISTKTTISFSNPQWQHVDVKIMNVLGKECAQIFSGNLDAGDHSFEWNASHVPDGVYFCIVRSESGVGEMPLVVRH